MTDLTDVTRTTEVKVSRLRREIAELEHELCDIDEQIHNLGIEREETEEQLRSAREELMELSGEDVDE
jgi:hypothetical protein